MKKKNVNLNFHNVSKEEESLQRVPWECIGTMPSDQQTLMKLNQDPQQGREVNYGGYFVNDAVKQAKPDVVIAAQDIWGVDFAIKKIWFDKVTPVIWTTLDSLPILPSAVEAAKRLDNYWIWSDFATKELNRAGYKQVKTMQGAIDPTFFYKQMLKYIY